MTGKIASLTILILLIFVAACNPVKTKTPTGSDNTYPVDTVFTKYYSHLGGEDVLGPAITPVFQNGAVIYQYTVAALMRYDPYAPANQHFQLAPLGLDLGVQELPVPQPTSGDVRYVDGHIIYKDFVPLFDRLGGVSVVGRPLTEVRFNTEKQRYEQFFENLGFYRLDDPASVVRLLAFGSWKCDNKCDFSTPPSSVIALATQVAAPFKLAISDLGTNFTGLTLTPPYLASDGNLEQVFDNVVMYANPEHPDHYSFRPIPEELGITVEPLSTQSPNPSYVFYPVQDDQGYNVLKDFMSYINSHGGVEISGPPISQIKTLPGDGFRQCFKNICLDGIRDATGKVVVHMVPLGYNYRDLYYKPSVEKLNKGLPSEISLQIWENSAMLNPTQKQEIGVLVHSGNDPLANAAPVLTITLPDNTEATFDMPLTGQDGESRIKVPPVNAENGTLIPYQVCITSFEGQKFCVRDSYLIWNTSALETNQNWYLPMIYRWFRGEIFQRFLPVIYR